MSLPSFPNMENIPSREEVVNLIVSSIALEELGLSHIINAEGEKIQYALGTIDGVPGSGEPITLEQLLKLNDSVRKTLDSTMMNQFLLKEKLIGALSSSVMQGPPGERGEPGPATIAVMEQVDCLEPDEAPYVHNDGTPEDLLLRFGIPKGEPGEMGTILGSFDTYEDLIEAHETGKQGDAYLVGGELYVWGQEPQTGWHSVGNLQGPPGPPLEQGQALFQILESGGTPVNMGYGESLSFESDTLEITLESGPVVKIEGSPSGGGAIIPFAAGERRILTAPAGSGHRGNAALIGFGASAVVDAAESDPIQVIINETTGQQFAFMMPVDGKITAMSAFVTTVGLSGILGVDSRLSAKIYYSGADDVYYSLLDDSAVLEFQFSGLIPSMTTRRNNKPLSLNVAAGTRLLFIFDYDAAPYGGGVLLNGHFGGSLKIE